MHVKDKLFELNSVCKNNQKISKNCNFYEGLPNMASKSHNFSGRNNKNLNRNLQLNLQANLNHRNNIGNQQQNQHQHQHQTHSLQSNVGPITRGKFNQIYQNHGNRGHLAHGNLNYSSNRKRTYQGQPKYVPSNPLNHRDDR